MEAGKSMEKASPKAMQAIGQSKPTAQTKANLENHGNHFLAYISEISGELSARWGTRWDDVPERELSQQLFWGHFATYIVDIHVIAVGNRSAGQPLDINPAHGLWSGLLNQARVLCMRRQGVNARGAGARPPAHAHPAAHACIG